MNHNEKINILIVDDRPENLFSLEAILERDEYRLVKALSGEEALKYLLKYDFAAILLDVQMPGMDGFGTAKIIKAREKTKNIPILFITANNMDSEHIFMGYSVGAIDYILKPFDPLILKAKVEGFVELYKMKNKLIHQAEELEERNRIIQHMALHDQLTNLPNRRLFNEQLLLKLHQAKRLFKPFGIMFLDMDRFRYVNDALGHAVGDKLLQEIALRLKASIREMDIVARVDGDEFNIILPETDRESALEVAELVLDAFKEPFTIDSYELYMTTSIGLSIFPYDGEDAVALIKNADAALYHAKEQGANKYKVFHSGMNISSYRAFLMQNDLRSAVEKDELELVFQPRVNLTTGKVTSFEALLRWNHPSWGKVSPNEFIPIAEKTDQIVKIGEWVLRKVCEQINDWKQTDIKPLRIALNFSAKHFLQKDLIDHIKNVLNETNVTPSLIEIEITESIFLGNEDIVTQSVKQLREMGIKISIDDFGTGYSSLNYLRRFPVDAIKIDQSFVRDISLEENNSLPIISSIVSLAKNLNMSVIVEGVETKEQLRLIQELNCEEIQGYIISPPLLQREVETFMMNYELPLQEKLSDKKNQTAPMPYETKRIDNDKELKKEILEIALENIQRNNAISSREMDVFTLLIDGLTNKEISEKLFISEHTVKNHITKILQKLNVTDRVQAIAMVYERCIADGEALLG